MTTRLIIARHGNTFESGEVPRRVGGRTDIPLTRKGEEQARAIGLYLKEHHLPPAVVYAGSLQRAHCTAEIALQQFDSETPLIQEAGFNEIDYGPDENKTDAEVVARIGEAALERWNADATVPPGWLVDPESIINNWHSFGNRICSDHPGQVVLVVTSNGIARFAPYLTGDFAQFALNYDIKIRTGALCILQATADNAWNIVSWDLRPG